MSKAVCRTCGAEGPPWNHRPSMLDRNGIGDPGHKVIERPAATSLSSPFDYEAKANGDIELQLKKGKLWGDNEQQLEVMQSPMYGIITDLVKNNKNLTPELQNSIARFIEIEAIPMIRADTEVTTATYERPEANTKAVKNAPESEDTPLKDTP